MKSILATVSVSIVLNLVPAFDVAPSANGATPITVPNSDGWYGTYVNVQNYVISYLPNISPDARLMTDLTGTNEQTWNAAITSVKSVLPSVIIGTYHSSRDSEASAVRARCYPQRAVPVEGLKGSQILYVSGDEYIVDYSQTDARNYLVSNIVSDVLSTKMPVAYLDNISSDEMGFPMPWSITMVLLQDIVSQLHARGVRVIINAAWAPGLTSQAYLAALINTGVDGVSLEMAFLDPQVRQSLQAIQTSVNQYRQMLDAGMTVIFIALPGTDPNDTADVEDHLQAAYGLMFRKLGDKLFIAQTYWQPIPDWTQWPAQLGPPQGNAVISTNGQGQIVMVRQFANGSVSLNAATRAVSVSFH